MKFSIIIPAFNSEKYLDECLMSVYRQSFIDFEVIGIDDGSTDRTLEIFNTFASRDDRFSAWSGPNQGLLLARRKGLSLARGEYIIFLDSDDCLRVDALELISRAINSSAADIVAFNYSRKFDFSSDDSPAFLEPGVYCGESYNCVRELVCRGRYNNLCGKAIRLKSIDVDTSYENYQGLMHGEDLIQFLAIVDRCSSLCQIIDVLYFYRPNVDSSTAQYKPSQLNDIVLVNKRLFRFAREWGGNCTRLAGIGESSQYCYLVKLSELSESSFSQKRAVFNNISTAMFEEGSFKRIHMSDLRLDNRVLILCLKNRWWRFAHWLVLTVERLKSVSVN